MTHDWNGFTESLTTLLKTSGDTGDSGDRTANQLISADLSVTTRCAHVSPVDLRVVTGPQTSGDAFGIHKQQLSEGVTSVTTVTTQFARGSDEDEGDAGVVRSAHIPVAWREGYRALFDADPLPDFSPAAWNDTLSDAGAFLETWGDQAARLGWRDVDVFGVHPDRPGARVGCWGLALLIQGGTVVAITDASATVRRQSGAMLTWRRSSAEQVALWELMRGAAR